jgi:nicotinate-nucleotide pyrophosphorylase (carboxylating)
MQSTSPSIQRETQSVAAGGARTDDQPMPRRALEALVAAALDEDVAWGDLTTEALVPVDLRAEADVLVKSSGVLAGLPVLEAVFLGVDPATRVERLAADGDRVDRGQVVARVSGQARSLLSAERVALNFLQRLSGIATATARYVAAVAGTKAAIIDTRKTTPGLRSLEKWAVRMGGGQNHRRNLSDGVLVKDNHLVAIAASGRTLAEAVAAARRRWPHTIKVEVEVDRLDQIADALAAGADIVLLDNMSPAQLGEAVGVVGGRAMTEASGGVTLESVRAVAEAGVDLISVGALTHSAGSLDISLELRIGS